ncbi:adenylosuccinate synthetase [Actinophytocola xanthii]|uniref:Adenylosuccinate synthetase n=1 Tax=Actinophytocola xanthii TaxID=1912961 RepID=A0A1Q8CNK5_9PSEU|nr:adenylosuccinate synthetase [Actinophytocola xanthii]OLF15945.1 hypothetical protein BU204_18730 [Actinophytocola xanthii]
MNSRENSCVDVIVGLQAGSEGKGKVVAYLSDRYDVAVRSGGHQAGHTVHFNGEPFAMRVLPCAWINPRCELVIAPGAFFGEEILRREIAMVEQAGVHVRHRLRIDPRVVIVDSRHADTAAQENRWERYGSTLQGVGAARMDKLSRDTAIRRADDVEWLKPYLTDTIGFIGNYINENRPVLLEGHQGSLLSIVTSPYYPMTTNCDPNAAGVLSDAAVSPLAVRDIIGVFRTYPIRVAGNSGPLAGREISWETVTRRSGSPVSILERTTVTGRVRRVFEFAEEDLKQALAINRPSRVALTFLDYRNWQDYGKRRLADLSAQTLDWLRDVVERCDLSGRLSYVSTGPEPDMMIDLSGDTGLLS